MLVSGTFTAVDQVSDPIATLDGATVVLSGTFDGRWRNHMPEIEIDKAQMLRSANDSARLILRKLAAKDADAMAKVTTSLAADTAAREALRPAEPEAAVDPVDANIQHLKLVMASGELDGMDVSVIKKAITVAETAKAAIEAR